MKLIIKIKYVKPIQENLQQFYLQAVTDARGLFVLSESFNFSNSWS